MSAEQLYEASPIKRGRPRGSTKAQVDSRRKRLLEIVRAMRPMTVRQVFYQATVRGIVEKSERGYTIAAADPEASAEKRRAEFAALDREIILP